MLIITNLFFIENIHKQCYISDVFANGLLHVVSLGFDHLEPRWEEA